MNFQELIKALPSAATNSYSFVAYIVLVIAIFLISWKVKRNKNLLDSLEKIPKNQRLDALRAEMGNISPAHGLTAEQWLRSRIHNYYFIAAIAIIICITIVLIIAFFNNELPSPKKTTANISIERIYVQNDEADPSYRFGKWFIDIQKIDNKGMILNEALFNSMLDKKEIINVLEWRNDKKYDDFNDFKNAEKSIPSTLIKEVKNTNFFKKNYPEDITEWRTPVVEYINSLIKPPAIHIVIRNTGEQSATIYGFKFINVRSFGGDAGAGASHLKVDNEESLATLNWEKNSELKFKEPLVLDAGNTTMLEIKLVVENAASGDGEGELLYRIELDYADGQNSHASAFIAAMSQSDYVGFVVW